jgi:hypothetical protein
MFEKQKNVNMHMNGLAEQTMLAMKTTGIKKTCPVCMKLVWSWLGWFTFHRKKFSIKMFLKGHRCRLEGGE